MSEIEQLEIEYEKARREYRTKRNEATCMAIARDHAEDVMTLAHEALSNARWDAIDWEAVEKEATK